MELTIRTDHKWKQFKYRYEVPAKVLRSQFDWLLEEAGFDGFFKYLGTWYHTSQFMRIENNEALAGWHGYECDSFFSGTLIKISEDGEMYQAGRYYS